MYSITRNVFFIPSYAIGAKEMEKIDKWQVQVRNAMKNADYTQWNNDLVKDITATEASGMKYLA